MELWKQCADRLIETGELDPVYTMLCSARDRKVVDEEWLAKFCMYQLLFYHIPGALKAAEQDDFWEYVLRYEPDLQRGQERRHFRGVNAKKSLRIIAGYDRSPLEILKMPYDEDYRDFYDNVQDTFRGFGDYFTLKWADLLDVVFHQRINFLHLPDYLFSGATSGLDLMFPDEKIREFQLYQIAEYINQFPDPFDGTRKCGESEAETIACGYKVYWIKTTFKFGYDIHHLRVALEGNKLLLEGCPPDTDEWR